MSSVIKHTSAEANFGLLFDDVYILHEPEAGSVDYIAVLSVVGFHECMKE